MLVAILTQHNRYMVTPCSRKRSPNIYSAVCVSAYRCDNLRCYPHHPLFSCLPLFLYPHALHPNSDTWQDYWSRLHVCGWAALCYRWVFWAISAAALVSEKTFNSYWMHEDTIIFLHFQSNLFCIPQNAWRSRNHISNNDCPGWVMFLNSASCWLWDLIA